VADQAFVETAIAHNEKWLPWLTREIAALVLKVTQIAGNFLLVHFPPDAAHNAPAADEFLVAQGLVLRRMEAYGLPGALRLTVGTEAANRAVVAALKDFMA
jgi:histidinol-phosphate aminotransferase